MHLFPQTPSHFRLSKLFLLMELWHSRLLHQWLKQLLRLPCLLKHRFLSNNQLLSLLLSNNLSLLLLLQLNNLLHQLLPLLLMQPLHLRFKSQHGWINMNGKNINTNNLLQNSNYPRPSQQLQQLQDHPLPQKLQDKLQLKQPQSKQHQDKQQPQHQLQPPQPNHQLAPGQLKNKESSTNGKHKNLLKKSNGHNLSLNNLLKPFLLQLKPQLNLISKQN